MAMDVTFRPPRRKLEDMTDAERAAEDALFDDPFTVKLPDGGKAFIGQVAEGDEWAPVFVVTAADPTTAVRMEAHMWDVVSLHAQGGCPDCQKVVDDRPDRPLWVH